LRLHRDLLQAECHRTTTSLSPRHHRSPVLTISRVPVHSRTSFPLLRSHRQYRPGPQPGHNRTSTRQARTTVSQIIRLQMMRMDRDLHRSQPRCSLTEVKTRPHHGCRRITPETSIRKRCPASNIDPDPITQAINLHRAICTDKSHRPITLRCMVAVHLLLRLPRMAITRFRQAVYMEAIL